MIESTRRIRSISKYLDDAWKTFDFSKVEKIKSHNNSIYMDLSRQLRAGLIDCVWYESNEGTISLTRSLKHKDTIQITSFFHHNGTLVPSCDIQVNNYEELIDNIHYGVLLHILSFIKQ